MSRRTIRTAPRIPILLVPFIAVGLVLLAIGYMIKFICQGIAALRAAKRASVAREARERPTKARKPPPPPMTPQDIEDAELERRWMAQIRAAKRDGLSKPPIVRVGGKRVLGRVVTMDELGEEDAAPVLPPPPAPSFEPWPDWEDAAPPPDMAGATPF